MTEIESDELVLGLEEVSEEAALELTNRWFSYSQEELYEQGDEHGYDVASVAQAAVPPEWDDQEGAGTFAYMHEAAQYFEFGAKEHEIEAVNAEYLAFDWPEMAGEPFGNTGLTFDEVFESSWPTVFFKSITHPGMPALRFLRGTREDVARETDEA